jgi:hypothetical protein
MNSGIAKDSDPLPRWIAWSAVIGAGHRYLIFSRGGHSNVVRLRSG